MAKLTPSDPAKAMVIRKVNPHITTLSVPFWRFGVLKFGGRATLVRMENGAVAVFSPVALTDEVKKTVAEMGELKYIAAPDIEHHIFLGPWHEAYPSAKVIGPAGLPEKRAKQKNEDVPFFATYEKAGPFSVDSEFDAEFDTEFIAAHMSKELVICHKPSKTLIEADLLFNLPATEEFSHSGEPADTGILTRIWNSFMNARGTAIGQKRFIWYAISNHLGDRPGYNESIGRIAKWDFGTIVPCHGTVIEEDAKGVFQTVFEWHLAALNTKKTT